MHLSLKPETLNPSDALTAWGAKGSEVLHVVHLNTF